MILTARWIAGSWRQSALTLLALGLAGAAAVGQVAPASKGGLPAISVGGEGSVFHPDFLEHRTYGWGLYANVMPARIHNIEIGAEGEMHFVDIDEGYHLHERTSSIGPIFRLYRPPGLEPWKSLQPFGKVMYGLGNFYYPYYTNTPPKFSSDSFGIWVFDGGLEYRLSRRLTLRGDWQYQKWTHFRGRPTLTPYGPNLGVSYRIF